MRRADRGRSMLGAVVLAAMNAVPLYADGATTLPPNRSDARVTLFRAKCATCHEEDGTGNPVLAGALRTDLKKMDLTSAAVRQASDDELAAAIRNGNGKMPSYGRKLSDADIAGLVSLIRSFGGARKTPAPATPAPSPKAP